jgi:hypothetical protein
MHRKVLSPVKKKARLLLLERAAQKSAGSRAQWWLKKEPGWSNDLGSCDMEGLSSPEREGVFRPAHQIFEYRSCTGEEIRR